MKTWLLALCAGSSLAAFPCRAQQPANDSASLMLRVYVAGNDENAPPRIALGLEKPALKIGAFEKCVRIYANLQYKYIAVQLKPEDAKALIAAIKALGAPDAPELPRVRLFFTTVDDKILDSLDTGANNAEGNLLNAGVVEFDPSAQRAVVDYLMEKLHP